jgi:acyl-[acyl-carrier-protein]-phospholipid O-acyltransferase/long-chain-fatty-acid--[acyl-carrier-protein] ligase
MLGVLLASGVFWVMRDLLEFSAVTVLAIEGFLTLCATAHIIYRAPEPFIRFLLLSVTRIFFRVRAVAADHIPCEGGALIVSNHVSFADAFVLSCATDRPIRFLMLRRYFEIPGLKPIFRLLRAIPISNDRPSKAALRALKETATYIQNGDLVCIFPEGRRTRTGFLAEFRRGTERIAELAGARPILPVYVQGLWGIPSSFKEKKSLWDYLLFRRTVTVMVGLPVQGPVTTSVLQARVRQLGSGVADLTATGIQPANTQSPSISQA